MIEELSLQTRDIVSDDNSTVNCRRKFEHLLGELEQQGEKRIERIFLRIKKSIRESLLQLADQNGNNSEYAEKLRALQHAVNGVSKKEAFDVIRSIRQLLRKSIPDLHKEDIKAQREKNVIARFEGRLPRETIDRIVRAMETGCHEELLAIGKEIPLALKTPYYEMLSDFYPDFAIYTVKFAKSYFYNERDKNRTRQTQKKVLEKLGRNSDPHVATLYATLARRQSDKEMMGRAAPLLQKSLHDPYCLTSYAAISGDLEREDDMEEAISLLEKNLDNPHCLTIYARIARMQRDHARMQIALEKLESQLHDPMCLSAYAKLAIAMKSRRAQTVAALELKKDLQRDGSFEALYIQLAEAA